MYEVYAATRPGRPRLLTVACAAALVASLAAAWVQVQRKQRLGDPVRIEGTPLVVQPPRGWIAAPHDRATFVQVLRLEGRRGAVETIERRVQFHYQRWPFTPPLSDLLKYRNFQDRSVSTEPVPTQVGPLAGVEVRRVRQFQFLGRQERGQTVYRLAISPRGEEVTVEYMPLQELSRGDVELLDEICASLRIDDPAYDLDTPQAVRNVGLEVPLESDWLVCGGDFENWPAMYVQMLREGVPAYSFGIFRTWLADRQPEDLLRDLACVSWRLPPDKIGVQTHSSNGRRIAQVRYPESAHYLAGALVVAEAPERALMIQVMADPQDAGEACDAAAQLAERVRFTGAAVPGDLAAARSAGLSLAKRVREDGGLSVWGRRDTQATFVGEFILEPTYRPTRVILQEERAFEGPRPGRYEGMKAFLREDAGRATTQHHETWWVEPGGHFGWELENAIHAEDILRIREQGDPGQNRVLRTVGESRPPQSTTYRVGAAYVCPPLMDAVADWAAAQESGAWLIEGSLVWASGAHTRLVQALGPVEGQHRVLIVDDYDPRGMLLRFDREGRLIEQIEPSGRLKRVATSPSRRLPRIERRP
jgi:hypothetical protein